MGHEFRVMGASEFPSSINALPTKDGSAANEGQV